MASFNIVKVEVLLKKKESGRIIRVLDLRNHFPVFLSITDPPPFLLQKKKSERDKNVAFILGNKCNLLEAFVFSRIKSFLNCQDNLIEIIAILKPKGQRIKMVLW